MSALSAHEDIPLEPCPKCHRKFHPARLEKHVAKCDGKEMKTATMTRKMAKLSSPAYNMEQTSSADEGEDATHPPTHTNTNTAPQPPSQPNSQPNPHANSRSPGRRDHSAEEESTKPVGIDAVFVLDRRFSMAKKKHRTQQVRNSRAAAADGSTSSMNVSSEDLTEAVPAKSKAASMTLPGGFARPVEPSNRSPSPTPLPSLHSSNSVSSLGRSSSPSRLTRAASDLKSAQVARSPRTPRGRKSDPPGSPATHARASSPSPQATAAAKTTITSSSPSRLRSRDQELPSPRTASPTRTRSLSPRRVTVASNTRNTSAYTSTATTTTANPRSKPTKPPSNPTTSAAAAAANTAAPAAKQVAAPARTSDSPARARTNSNSTDRRISDASRKEPLKVAAGVKSRRGPSRDDNVKVELEDDVGDPTKTALKQRIQAAKGVTVPGASDPGVRGIIVCEGTPDNDNIIGEVIVKRETRVADLIGMIESELGQTPGFVLKKNRIPITAKQYEHFALEFFRSETDRAVVVAK
eukprot:c13103_g1_i1.p1 GENE.c13103_g1_i1~~c13103_g1_i1.p1  ORF type:complete len:569 (+),score=109.69 c13103_g1_i1:141-1709(+)